MVFSSREFVFCFLPLALITFYLCKAFFGRGVCVAWLLALSLFFYAYWYPPYLLLLLATYAINYAGSLLMLRYRRGWLLALLILANLLFIGYFKYFNFFIDNVNLVCGLHMPNDKIALPLGISFYTFQQIAYLVEAYREGERARNFLEYCLFPSFFPHLIAGPIVYFREIKPLFEQKGRGRRSRMFNQGLSFFLIGLFKKLVLADNLAVAADSVFKACASGQAVTTAESWVGASSYALQLYFDFSGYSEMAIGLGLLFGVRMPLNFFSPYKATSLIEFWRRWHMTMTRFFQTYLYTPLSLWVTRRASATVLRYGCILATMLVIGLWHGAGWTWILWGGLNGLLLIGNHLFRACRRWAGVPHNPGSASWLNLPFRVVSWWLTLTVVICCWVLFRADNVAAAGRMYRSLFALNGVSLPAHWSLFLGTRTTLWLQRLGIQFQGGLGPEAITEFQILSPFLLLLFCALAPNTVEFMRYFAPGRLRGMDWGRANSVLASARNLIWRPSWGVALMLGFLFALVFASLIDDSVKSVFIYFQF